MLIQSLTSLRFIALSIGLTGIFLAGCGLVGTQSEEGQEIMRDQFSMRIDERFGLADISRLINPSLRPSLIQAYSIPSPSSEFFEKNIIISREASASSALDLAAYATDVSEAIRQTWWGYTRLDLSDTSFLCGETQVPVIRHSFSLARGEIAQTGWQTLFFIQSLFQSGKMFYIVSASSDDERDMDAFEWYMETLGCGQEESEEETA